MCDSLGKLIDDCLVYLGEIAPKKRVAPTPSPDLKVTPPKAIPKRGDDAPHPKIPVAPSTPLPKKESAPSAFPLYPPSTPPLPPPNRWRQCIGEIDPEIILHATPLEEEGG